MSSVRQAAVAGRFYPADPSILQREVDALLAAAQPSDHSGQTKALVVPHAGHIYSGPVAADAYRLLQESQQPPTRVILLGPAHRVAFKGIASSSAAAFRTPLGDIPVDRDALARIADLPGVHCRDAAHAPEHSLEVHLPFLQRSLGQFQLLPLVVGDAPTEQVAAVIEALWGGPETLLVISSDLSHFLDYDRARARDANTARRIEALATDLHGEEACGCRPLNGLLSVLKARGLSIRRLAMNNSGDTAGDRDRVVGYGAWCVTEADAPAPDDEDSNDESLGLAQRQQLLHAARLAIGHTLAGQGNLDIRMQQYDSALHVERASFVTLNLEGSLRGCIGSLTATRPLLVDVLHNATAAAFRDRRFKPLTAGEYTQMELHISVLSPARPLAVSSRAELLERLTPGVHGLVLSEAGKRAAYLPSVWAKLPDPDHFLGELRAKAGLPREGWSADTKVSIYTTEEFS
ncbi:MAG: AmmeMemoRadiSam system protein B [Halieaceae bacterium]|jgi:AmmeMemoRadiSam system protein B/AmmeMemoRadiSam system protein A|nr:AmmeMemoRadiSam system protein B [Halieaceae bacterium]